MAQRPLRELTNHHSVTSDRGFRKFGQKWDRVAIRKLLYRGCILENLFMRTYTKCIGISTMAVLVGTCHAFAQPSAGRIESRIRRAEASAIRLERELQKVRNENERERSQTAERIYSLEEKLKASEQRTQELETGLASRIDAAQMRSETKFTTVDASFSRSYGFMALGGIALAALSGLFFFLVSRRVGSHRLETEEKIRQTRQSLEEENVKLDEKLIEIFDRKLVSASEANQSATTNGEPDHSLALKVADEIVRIEKNLAVMDPDIRGRKQLAASVERIRDNFAANGYEIVAMLNKPYDDGIRADVNFLPDENLAGGQQIITKVFKPQVNYRGIMIQTAQVEVSHG